MAELPGFTEEGKVIVEVADDVVQTLAWKERKARKIVRASKAEFEPTLLRLMPLIGTADVIEGLVCAG